MQKDIKLYKRRYSQREVDRHVERLIAQWDYLEDRDATEMYSIQACELAGDEAANYYQDKVVDLDNARRYYKAQKEKTIEMLTGKKRKEAHEARVKKRKVATKRQRELRRDNLSWVYWQKPIPRDDETLAEKLERRWQQFVDESPVEYSTMVEAHIDQKSIKVGSSIANRVCDEAIKKAVEKKTLYPEEQVKVYKEVKDCILTNKKFNTVCFRNMLVKHTVLEDGGSRVLWNRFETAVRYFFEWRVECFI